MIRAEELLLEQQGLLIEDLRVCVLALLLIKACQRVDSFCDIGMRRTVDDFVDGLGAKITGLCKAVLAPRKNNKYMRSKSGKQKGEGLPIQIESAQVVEAHGEVRVIGAENLLALLDRFLQELLGAFVAAHILMKATKGIQRLCDIFVNGTYDNNKHSTQERGYGMHKGYQRGLGAWQVRARRAARPYRSCLEDDTR